MVESRGGLCLEVSAVTRREKVIYLTGCVVGLLPMVILTPVTCDLDPELGNRIRNLENAWFGASRAKRDSLVRREPDSRTLRDLKALRATYENTLDLTDAGSGVQGGLMAEFDAELGFVLKPNMDVTGYVLYSNKGDNTDPPVVYIDNKAQRSSLVTRYLEQETIISHAITSGGSGYRTTLPPVHSESL